MKFSEIGIIILFVIGSILYIVEWFFPCIIDCRGASPYPFFIVSIPWYFLILITVLKYFLGRGLSNKPFLVGLLIFFIGIMFCIAGSPIDYMWRLPSLLFLLGAFFLINIVIYIIFSTIEYEYEDQNDNKVPKKRVINTHIDYTQKMIDDTRKLLDGDPNNRPRRK